jgi:hypothetical protein
VSLRSARRLIFAAEQQRPPWRLAAFSASAEGESAGQARVSMEFVGVERSQPDGER